MPTPAWRRLAPVLAALALLVLMVSLSRDFGFTWDERVQQKYGEQIWDYYHGRQPRAIFDDEFANQYLYTGLVEVLCVAAQHALHHADTYVVRHAIVAVFGWLAIVGVGLLGARIGGPRVGWLGATLLVVSPRFFADAMNNSKDLPFATVTLAALYCITRIAARPPFLSWVDTAMLGVAITLAINIRPIGFILVPFAAVVLIAQIGVFAWRERRFPWIDAGSAGIRLAVITAFIIPAASLTWPWAQRQPFWLPLRGFLLVSRADWTANFQVLYRGRDLISGEVPWHYLPTWMLIATPPVILLGMPFAVFARRRLIRPGGATVLAGFVGIVAIGVIGTHSSLYDGIRHLTFILPPLTILAAIGWDAIISSPHWIGAAGAVLLALGVAEPLVFQVRNHPHQSVYFTPLMGGPRAAFLRYDMDYWGNSMLAATAWADRMAQRSHAAIVVTGNPLQALQGNAPRFKSLYVVNPYSRQALQAELDVRLLRGPREAVRAMAERPDILYRVSTADGTPLCVVLPGPAFGGLAARMADR